MSEQLLKQILNNIADLAEGQSKIIQRLDNLETKVDRIDETVNEINKTVNGSQKDVNSMLEVVSNRTERLETKMERIAGDVNFLVRKTVEHEDDIRNLRLIR